MSVEEKNSEEIIGKCKRYEVKLLDEEYIHECINIDNVAPVSLQLTDREIVDVAMNAD